jgi:formylmethanofuran dehydrogenase subunit B
MAVAWIGNREASVEEAVAHAVSLLKASRHPLFTVDGDVACVRAGLDLARRLDGMCDHRGGPALAAETALATSHGGIFMTPAEARARADLLIVAGEPPAQHAALIRELAGSVPTLAPSQRREVYALAGAGVGPESATGSSRLWAGSVTATLQAICALLRGRPVARPLDRYEAFSAAVDAARTVAVACWGLEDEPLALEAVQRLVSLLNSGRRAGALLLTSSEGAWTAMQVSGWSAGFPLPLRFAAGAAVHDPWQFAGSRVSASREADLHVAIGGGGLEPGRGTLVAIVDAAMPAEGAAVTISAASDGMGVRYSAAAATLTAVQTGDRAGPSATDIVDRIASLLGSGERVPC